jgi:hypothetical protein
MRIVEKLGAKQLTNSAGRAWQMLASGDPEDLPISSNYMTAPQRSQGFDAFFLNSMLRSIDAMYSYSGVSLRLAATVDRQHALHNTYIQYGGVGT